ncbi:MAG: outer membrane lipoprotein carrier protein LolA [Rubrivivax sp.]|nr:MAG: outer membrane lipoprotein carrier protein LolA [Rubrivivax sp.]
MNVDPSRRRLLALVALSAIGLPTAARAATDEAALMKGVQARLRQPEWLRGDFEQSKQVPGFKKPVVSRGDFVVARGRGVLWRTRTPFESELRLTRDEIRASQGGATAMRMDAQREPALRLVNEMMFALLGGDVGALSKLFALDGELIGAAAWKLDLRPRQAAWLHVLQRLALSGDTHVRAVELVEAGGDVTRISFSNLRDTAPEGGARLFD